MLEISFDSDRGAANLDLASNPFYREFTNSISIAGQAAGLPDMGGSGLVRDLREAASLSAGLATVLAQFSAATTGQAQLDGLTTTNSTSFPIALRVA